MIKAISFDFYDTLFEIPEDAKNFMNMQIADLIKKNGGDNELFLSILYGQVWEDFTLGKFSTFQQAVLHDLELTGMNDNLSQDIGLILERVWRKELLPLQNAQDVIHLLSKKYKLAIVSNAIGEPEKRALERYQLWDKFSTVIFSSQLQARKPDAKLFVKLLQDLKFQPQEVVHVGDLIEHDILPARNIGMKTVLVGQDRIGKANACIKNLSELPDVIRRLDE